MSWFLPEYYGGAERPKAGVLGFGVSVALHGLVLVAVVFGVTHAETLEQMARPIAVSLLESPRPQPEKPQPKPLPPPTPKTKAPPLTTPMPVAMAAASTPSQAPSGVAAPAPALAPAPAAAEGPLVAATFDADYLSNPKPPYPLASRRLNETGTVYLRVHVSADGAAMAVELKQGSGYARLDQSALETVARWRFVPARRGSVGVSSWVVVPVVFSLT